MTQKLVVQQVEHALGEVVVEGVVIVEWVVVVEGVVVGEGVVVVECALLCSSYNAIQHCCEPSCSYSSLQVISVISP